MKLIAISLKISDESHKCKWGKSMECHNIINMQAFHAFIRIRVSYQTDNITNMQVFYAFIRIKVFTSFSVLSF